MRAPEIDRLDLTMAQRKRKHRALKLRKREAVRAAKV